MPSPQPMSQTFKREVSPLDGSSPSYSRYASPASTSLTSPCTSPKQVPSPLSNHLYQNPSGFLPPVSPASDAIMYGSPNSRYSQVASFPQSPGSPYCYNPNGPYSPGYSGGHGPEYSPYAHPLSPASPPVNQSIYPTTSPRPLSQVMDDDDDDDGDGVWYTRDGKEVRYAGMHMECATM